MGVQRYWIAMGNTDLLYQANQDYPMKIPKRREATSGKIGGYFFRRLFPDHFKNSPIIITLSIYSLKVFPNRYF